MEGFTYGIGLVAAALTSLSYAPQVRKAYPRGSTADLSFKTLAALAAGLALWVVYGLLKADTVVALANIIGLLLVGTLIAFKLRDRGMREQRSSARKGMEEPRCNANEEPSCNRRG